MIETSEIFWDELEISSWEVTTEDYELGMRSWPLPGTEFSPRERKPLLTAEEEQALARRIEQGDEKARHHLIEANYGLVFSVVNRYRQSGVPMEDLIQEGLVGLIRAVDKFDYRKGCRFSTCAVTWIRAQVLHAILKSRSLSHVPERVYQAARKLGQVADELEQQLHHPPTLEELAAHTGWSPEQIEQLMLVSDGWVSLDEPVSEDTDLQDMVEDEETAPVEEQALTRVLAEQIQEGFKTLSARERTILRLRYGLEDGEERTLAEIGQRFNLTRQRIRSIEQEALAKLRCGGCSRPAVAHRGSAGSTPL